MADKTGIAWTDASWNPVRGCSMLSDGCRNCYAMRQARRMDHPGGAYEGLTQMGGGKVRWSGKVVTVPKLLDQPLRWTRARRIFVNSMSDLFHADVPRDFIATVYGVAVGCPQHVFQVLTKRPDGAKVWYEWFAERQAQNPVLLRYRKHDGSEGRVVLSADRWPPPNLWFGVSAENQKTYDQRMPTLMTIPAAVRWLSLEPLLGPIDLRLGLAKPDWVVVGGESGQGARECNVDWIRDIVRQCQEHRVPVFVKQLGAELRGDPWMKVNGKIMVMDDRMGTVWPVVDHPKGGDPEEWPEDLRVRQYPGEVSP